MKVPRDTLQTACSDFEEDLVLHYYGDGSEPNATGWKLISKNAPLVGLSSKTCESCSLGWRSLTICHNRSGIVTIEKR